MFKILSFTAALLATSGVSSAVATPSYSDQTLEILDPTRLARSACGTGLGQRDALDQRLRLAASYAEQAGDGLGALPLYSNISRAQIPAAGLEGEARRFFDQGVALTYGFNHKAAIRSFREARRLAPACAMCWWGEALANGPNINAGMDDAQNRAALAALVEAERLAAGAPALERALIAAQKHRYSAGADADRATLDAAYADEMLTIARANPDNDDLAVLAAEAAMNTTPWNYWSEDKGQAQPRVGNAIALIERVMARNPKHPQAAHLYIHLMENSADPKKAEAAADRLVGSAPGALGHLVHMPAHIYHRIGRYPDSMKANVAAARADEEYLAQAGDDGVYRFGYYPHNVHFLLTSGQMIGAMHTVASESARLSRILNADVARALPWVQAIHAAPSFALAQYGSPEAILALNDTPTDLAYVEAMRRYARANAFAHRRDAKAFGSELAALDTLATSAEVKAMAEGGFPADGLIRLAGLVARGKQAQLAGHHAEAVKLYEQAEAIEATVPYSEPAYWYYPVAQSRGAALYQAGRYGEARDAFMKALFAAPNNAWALWGLSQAQRKLGNRVEALAAEMAFARIWQGEREWLRMDRL
jgi:tetratricopeptide (TPR) repeat protein